MKKITLMPCLLLFLFSCQNEVKKNSEVTAQDSSYFDPNYKYVQTIPDSLRTDEQKELAKKIQSVIDEYQKVEDNQMVFTLTKEEFVAKGIPVEYYMLIQKDLVNNNKFFKENNINVDSAFKASSKNHK